MEIEKILLGEGRSRDKSIDARAYLERFTQEEISSNVTKSVSKDWYNLINTKSYVQNNVRETLKLIFDLMYYPVEYAGEKNEIINYLTDSDRLKQLDCLKNSQDKIKKILSDAGVDNRLSKELCDSIEFCRKWVYGAKIDSQIDNKISDNKSLAWVSPVGEGEEVTPVNKQAARGMFVY